MSIIKILPDHLINQIAAGEVVERPASVVKELVENAIDAKAKRIEIHIEAAGKRKIRVIDDGVGMSKEDAILAVKRHATSKIADEKDLSNILSLGFRGEALASIAAISKLKLETKPEGPQEGTLVICRGESEEKIQSCGCPKGTSVTVEDIFFNTPARQKYLKSEQSEWNQIMATVTELALSKESTDFILTHNGKTIYNLPNSSEWLDRIRALHGKEIAENLIPIFYGGQEISLEGFIGKPHIARNTKLHQYFFVNSRSIKSSALAYAVKEAYHSLLPHGMHPVFFVRIKIDPAQIDVNVHPRKIEIRFQNQSATFSILHKAVKTSLESRILSPKMNFGQSIEGIAKMKNYLREERTSRSLKTDSGTPEILTKASTFTDSLTEENLRLMPVAQIAASYIIAKDDEGMVIIDQHAAHERCMYEKLMKNFDAHNPVKQQLLVPLNIDLSHREKEVLSEQKELLEKMGFEIESLCTNSFVITAIPSLLSESNIIKVLRGLIGDILTNRPIKSTQEPREKVLTYMACRSAIKFGKTLTHEEQIALLKNLDSLDQKFTCPHGRPTMIRLPYSELEKKFGRR